MADSEGPTGAVGGGAIDGGEAGGARAMLGGSLPPRKRLLAGLKQNGGWLAASSGGSPAATVMPGVGGHSLEGGGGGGGMGAMAAQGGSGGGQVETIESKEGCVSCGGPESGAWRRLKRNGVLHRLCNSCAVLCHKNHNCPICLAVYPDVKDPSVWLQCCRCQRSVHMECEKKKNPSGQLESSSYMCPECVQAKKCKEMSNGSGLGARAKGCASRVAVNCSVDAGICASSAAAECSSPCSKKPRMHREVRIIKDGDEQEASIERICSEVKTGLGRKGVSSQEAAAAAAAAAAATACRAAQVAKALAAAKAAAAVKAAAAAKAALDAAALAARAEAQARAEFRRNSGSSDITSKQDAAHLRKDRAEKPEVKVEGEDAHGGVPQNIDDEELARQLHRAINSSPRISRSLTPLCRKAVPSAAGGKPGAEATRAWPRTQQPLSSPTEHRHLQCAKHQQTRPRSLVGGHKEVKRLDSRVMKKPGEICQNSANQQPSADDALKSEPADSSTVSHVEQGFSTGQQDYQSVPLEIMKGEADCQFGGVSEVYSGAEMNHDIRLSDAEVSQAAAMLDEVLMSEEAEQQAAAGALDEGCLTGYGDGGGARELESHCAGWQVGANAGLLHNQEGRIAVEAETVNLPSAVSVPFPSSEIKSLETPNIPAGGDAVVVEGQWAANDGGSSKLESVKAEAQETSNQFVQEGSLPSVKEEIPSKVGSGSQELDGSPSQPVAPAKGQVRHQGVAKGMSGGGKGFTSGSHFSSPPSIPT